MTNRFVEELVLESEALLALHIDRFLRLYYSVVRSRIPRSSGKPISYIQCLVLQVVSDSGPLTVGELVESLSRDKSQVSRTVQELLKLDLLETAQSQNDRRMMIIASTSRGDRLAGEIRSTMESCTTFLLGQFTPDETERFRNLLSKINSGALSDPI